MDGFNPVSGVAMIVVILNLGAPLDYHLILGAGLFTAIYILARAPENILVLILRRVSQNRRILIVEDEIPICSMIALRLKKHGYACNCVADGAEAADKIENSRCDLILLDVMLPGLSGFELMDLICPLEIPVIFLTARDAVEDRLRAVSGVRYRLEVET